MKRKMRGSFTIEASVIVPVILMVFAVVVTMLFYYHDKNVTAAITHETLVMGCGREGITAEEIEQYLQKRVGNKLLLFGSLNCETEIQDDQITVVCTARKKGMSLRSKMSMKRTNPEDFIWKLRRIQGLKK